MKVLIISYYNSWVTHFGVELEIAQTHLDQGDTVEFLGCDRCLGTCEANAKGRISKCDRCRLRRAGGLRLLSSPPALHLLSDYLPASIAAAERDLRTSIRDASTAENYTFNGHDLGSGALSSAIWNSRDPFCEKDNSLPVLQHYASAAVRSYLCVRKFLAARRDFQRVYVFNGRFATTRGALRACQEVAGLEVVTHERGPNIRKYGLFFNAMPHDRELWVQQAHLAWDTAPDREQAILIGSSFFEERRHGRNVDWTSFTGKQAVGKLPSEWDAQRTNIAIYNSSEDEFVGLGDDWKNPIYAMQAEGIRRIVTDALTRYPEAMFYLRMHPNLSGVTNRDIELINALEASGLPNLVVIRPDSDISTYSLLDAVDQVITFGSTVGVEATFWGKSSIHAGRSLYEDLGAAHVARSHEHVLEMIATRRDPQPKIQAIKYGYYAKTFGHDCKYWQAEDFSHGQFRGQSIKCEPGSWLLRRMIVMAMDILRFAARRRKS
ncbi:MAG: hypothetical protein WCJ14_02765 [Verrucomicrobiota bacterium]